MQLIGQAAEFRAYALAVASRKTSDAKCYCWHANRCRWYGASGVNKSLVTSRDIIALLEKYSGYLLCRLIASDGATMLPRCMPIYFRDIINVLMMWDGA